MNYHIDIYLDGQDNFTYRSYRLEGGVGVRNTKIGSVWAPPGSMLVPDGKGDFEIVYGR